VTQAGAPRDAAIDTRRSAVIGVDIRPKTPHASWWGAKAVIWNGPMGVFEIPPFDTGTNALARAVAEVIGMIIVGGGDSVSAVSKAGVADRITQSRRRRRLAQFAAAAYCRGSALADR
jgi:phosphoglycerate kinase